MNDLDTRIDGTPGSLRAVSTWLRSSFGDQAEQLADAAFAGRTKGMDAWEGASSTAFGDRAKVLGAAADTARDSAVMSSGEIDTLATALDRALNDMATVRSEAAAATLAVSGTVVVNPGPRLQMTAGAPPGSTPVELARYDAEHARVVAQNTKVDAFEKACRDADRVFSQWTDAITKAANAWTRWDAQLASLGTDFLTGAISAGLVMKVAPILSKQAQFLRGQAARSLEHAAALRTPTGKVVDPKAFYNLLDDAARTQGQAAEAAGAARNVKLPKGIGRGLGLLGVFATGYAIHEDMEQGESATQAVTSNVGGLLAGMVAGAAVGAPVGAAIGTLIPVPGVGTAAGLVAGAVVGSVAGAFSSGVIDAIFTEGITNVEAAVDAGFDEVANLGSAVSDLASDAWDAIF